MLQRFSLIVMDASGIGWVVNGYPRQLGLTHYVDIEGLEQYLWGLDDPRNAHVEVTDFRRVYRAICHTLDDLAKMRPNRNVRVTWLEDTTEVTPTGVTFCNRVDFVESLAATRGYAFSREALDPEEQ